MFIILLKFTHNKHRAKEFVEGHRAWIARGFDDGVFLVAGSLQDGIGGGILAHKTTLSDLQRRVEEDPFVAEDVVTAQVFELTPSRADQRLALLSAEEAPA